MESKTGKIVAAVLMTVLMLVFLLPAGVEQMGGGGSGGELGSVGGQPVGRDDLREAEYLLSVARSVQVGGLPLPVYQLALPDLERLQQLIGLFGPEQGQQLVAAQQQALAEAAARVASLAEDPLRLYLLLREASSLGGATRADAAAILSDPSVSVTLPNGGRTVPFSSIEGEALRERYLAGAQAALNLAVASRRYGQVAKVSRPVAARQVAATSQEVTLGVVPVAYDDYVATVEAPDDAALQAQFDKYKDVAPGTVTIDNPFGFGYQRPDRVSLGYLAFTVDAANDAVIEKLTAEPVAARELAMFRYFTDNRDDFAAATRPSTQPASRPAPSTQPASGVAALLKADNAEVADFLDAQAAGLDGDELATWQAYANAHDAVVRATIDQRARDLGTAAFNRAQSILSADFAARRAALDSGGTASPTRVSIAADNPAYLDAVADRVGEQEGFRPDVVTTGDEPVDVASLSNPAIVGDIAGAGAGNLPFAQLVASATVPLLDEAGVEAAQRARLTIEPYRPGPLLTDAQGNAYLFRLTEAAAAEAPQSLDAVRDEVAEDVRRQRAYEQAAARATEIAGSGDLAAAGEVTVLGPFTPNAGPSNLPATGPLSRLDAAARNALGRGTLDLLAATDGAGVIALPTVGVALAAEKRGVTPRYTTETELETSIAAARARVAEGLVPQAAALADYFSAESVMQRTGFEPAE